MEQLGEHCSPRERRADEATRDVARLKCIYLRAHIGETFDVIVTSVVAFGLFVRCSRFRSTGSCT